MLGIGGNCIGKYLVSVKYLVSPHLKLQHSRITQEISSSVTTPNIVEVNSTFAMSSKERRVSSVFGKHETILSRLAGGCVTRDTTDMIDRRPTLVDNKISWVRRTPSRVVTLHRDSWWFTVEARAVVEWPVICSHDDGKTELVLGAPNETALIN